MTKADERRTETRIDKQTTIFIEVCSGDSDDNASPQIIICNSLDLSANGILVQMDNKVAIGSILRLCAELPDEETAMYLVGEVKWVTPCDDHFNIGFELYDAENTDIVGWKNIIAKMLD